MYPLFSGHYLRNRSTLDIGVLGYIGIVYHKEHSPEVLHIPPGTPCIANEFKCKNIWYLDNNIFTTMKYRGADKSLARPTARHILFDGENISFDASLVM